MPSVPFGEASTKGAPQAPIELEAVERVPTKVKVTTAQGTRTTVTIDKPVTYIAARGSWSLPARSALSVQMALTARGRALLDGKA
jgi:hypothetical protein